MISMLIIFGVYIALVIFSIGKIIRLFQQEAVVFIQRSKEEFEYLLKKQAMLRQQKELLEQQYHQENSFYELTREATKGLDEVKAVQLFEQYLRKHINFQSCSFLDPLDAKVSVLRQSSDWFVFPLKAKRRLIGYVALEGVGDQDQEIIRILGHQLVLALRQIKLYQEIEQIAISDSLTSLYTRRYTLERFHEEFHRAKASKAKLSFMMIDVDYFKSINDKYGHLVGDQVLRKIAQTIRKNIREIDLAGRYGGEEFCVVLPDADHKGVLYVGERIRTSVEALSVKAYDATLQVTVSIGAATYPDDAKNPDIIIDKADWALYCAKKQGRNRLCAVGCIKES